MPPRPFTKGHRAWKMPALAPGKLVRRLISHDCFVNPLCFQAALKILIAKKKVEERKLEETAKKEWEKRDRKLAGPTTSQPRQIVVLLSTLCASVSQHKLPMLPKRTSRRRRLRSLRRRSRDLKPSSRRWRTENTSISLDSKG